MPFLPVQTDSGLVEFCYHISTPTETNTTRINPDLPSILCLHSIYIPQTVFHAQFADPQLRRFNLISIDARGHGQTRGPVPETFTPKGVAKDLRLFLDALNVEKCHVLSVSFGSIFAMQFAMDYPDDTLTLACVSPSTLAETAHTIEGMQQIHEVWLSSYSNTNNLDEGSIVHTLYHAAEFGVNNFLTDTIKAVLRQTLSDGTKTWVAPNFDNFAAATIQFIENRTPPSPEELSRIKCPVRLLYCSEDLIYTADDIEGLRNDLLAAGVDVAPVYTIVNAPHFGNLFFSDEINSILLELMLSRTEGAVPPAPKAVESPYVQRLMEYMEIDDEDDDEFYIETPVSEQFTSSAGIRI